MLSWVATNLLMSIIFGSCIGLIYNKLTRNKQICKHDRYFHRLEQCQTRAATQNRMLIKYVK